VRIVTDSEAFSQEVIVISHALLSLSKLAFRSSWIT